MLLGDCLGLNENLPQEVFPGPIVGEGVDDHSIREVDLYLLPAMLDIQNTGLKLLTDELNDLCDTEIP